MGYRVVVAGATGNVGREMINILAEREFPIDELAVVASSRSQGDQIEYGETGKMLTIKNIEHFDPTGWDIALFAIGSDATEVYAPKFAAAGCVVAASGWAASATTVAASLGRISFVPTRIRLGLTLRLAFAITVHLF